MPIHAGRTQEERRAQRKNAQPRAQDVAGGEMAVRGTESNKTRSSGDLSEEGKRIWRTGSGIDGGGKC